jgi:hypothetical protein
MRYADLLFFLWGIRFVLLRSFVAFGALSFVFCAAVEAKETPLQKIFVQTQEALALGDIKLFSRSVDKMEQTFALERGTLNEAEREQYAMWLYHFQFKRHQFNAELPSIKEISAFETAQAIEEYARRFEAAIESLQKAHTHLRRYNELYNKLALTQGLQAQIALQASLSLERDLDILVRQGQIYITLLRFARSHWDDKKMLKRRMEQQASTVKMLQRQQQIATVQREALEEEQKRLSAKVKEAHRFFLVEQINIAHRRRVAYVLLSVGVVLAVAGIVGAVMGGIFLHDSGARENPYLTKPTFAECNALESGLQKTLCFSDLNGADPIIMPPRNDTERASWREFIAGGGVAFLSSGIAATTVGVGLILVGALFLPAAQAEIKSVLQSQEKFLKEGKAPGSAGYLLERMPILTRQTGATRQLLGVFD